MRCAKICQYSLGNQCAFVMALNLNVTICLSHGSATIIFKAYLDLRAGNHCMDLPGYCQSWHPWFHCANFFICNLYISMFFSRSAFLLACLLSTKCSGEGCQSSTALSALINLNLA